MIAIINNFRPHTGLGKYAFSLFGEVRKKTEAELLYLESQDNKIDEKILGMKKIRQGYHFPFFNKTLSWYYYFPPRIPDGYALYHSTSQYLARIAKYRKPAIISHFDLAPLVFPHEFPLLLRFFLGKSLSFYPDAEIIHTSSEKRRQELIGMGIKGLEEKSIVNVPIGINQKMFFPEKKQAARKMLGLPLDKKIILNVGSEEARKNIPVLLQAFRQIQEQHNDALLVRVGNTSRKYDGMKKGMGIMHFSGVPEEQLRLFYSAADAFVFPTLYEGFGFPVLEAMACGCPAITTDELDVFKDGCIIVEKNNHEQIMEHAERLLEKESIARKYSKRAIETSEKFTMEKAAEKISGLYDSVIG